jgi:hypothetical protein
MSTLRYHLLLFTDIPLWINYAVTSISDVSVLNYVPERSKELFSVLGLLNRLCGEFGRVQTNSVA